jgi:hypothetical protein
MHHIIYPGETDGVKDLYLNTMLPHMFEMFFLQWAVIALISEGIKQCTHLHTAVSLLFKETEESVTDAVVAEVEVFEMYTVAGITDGLKFCCKLFPAIGEKLHMVVMRKCYSFLP